MECKLRQDAVPGAAAAAASRADRSARNAVITLMRPATRAGGADKAVESVALDQCPSSLGLESLPGCLAYLLTVGSNKQTQRFMVTYGKPTALRAFASPSSEPPKEVRPGSSTVDCWIIHVAGSDRASAWPLCGATSSATAPIHFVKNANKH
jgi:hypothetical protein